MADIYAAHDRMLGREVAVKVLGDRYANDDGLRERFTREAHAAARLSGHPHIVTIFDVGEWRGRPLIVMEYLPGGTLEQRLRGAPIRPPQALEWLAETADALDAAHAAGIVHRDVKPANLLFDERELLHVADFGIARVADDSSRLTMTGTVMGTAGYISPEQARGERATAASDIYSLGAVAYELLTGARPFERSSATAEAAAHANEPPRPPSELNLELPVAVDDALGRALAKEPRARQTTAGELVAELRAAFSSEAEPTRLLPPVPATRPTSPGFAAARRAVPLVLAALALVGAGVAAAMLTTASGGGDVRTVVVRHTVTTQGKRVVKKVTVTQSTAEATTAPAATAGAATDAQSGARLNDNGYALMQSGRYSEALPLLQQSVASLQGSYSSAFRDEAYAEYNLGYTLLQVGRCSEALTYLNRSEQLQGYRSEIAGARAAAERCLAGPPPPPPAAAPAPAHGNGKHKGNGNSAGNGNGNDNSD